MNRDGRYGIDTAVASLASCRRSLLHAREHCRRAALRRTVWERYNDWKEGDPAGLELCDCGTRRFAAAQ
jgi:hypothetical protein